MTVATPNAPAKASPDVGSMLMDPKFKQQIAAALPRHMTPTRMARIALTEIRKNPELARCDPMSFLGAIIQCSQLGLEPGNGLGHAYLIPFWNKKRQCKEVQMIPGYRGLIDLSRRSGQIETISARVVYENDEFDYAYGLDERLDHVPATGDRGKPTYVYAVAKLKGGGRQMEVMSMEQVDAIRKRGNDNPVWKSDFDEMARKTAVRRIVKYLPMSPELAVAVDVDNREYNGESQDNHALIDIDYTPVQPVSDEATTPAAMNAEGEVKNEARTLGDLKGQFVTAVGKAARTRDIKDIYAHLGIEPGFDINKFTAPQFVAMLELMKTLPEIKQ